MLKYIIKRFLEEKAEQESLQSTITNPTDYNTPTLLIYNGNPLKNKKYFYFHTEIILK